MSSEVMAKSVGEHLMYKVLERANLLNYYSAFISQGGDDVHQLCEAGEEEFLEIMALVGMASKPLQVRRLQKVLQEFITNPAMFQDLEAEESPKSPAPSKGSIMEAVKKMGFSTDTFDSTPIKNLQHIQNSAFGTQGFTFDPSTFAIVVAPKSDSSDTPEKQLSPVESVKSPSENNKSTPLKQEEMPASLEPIWKAPELLNISTISNGSDRSLSATPPSLTPSILDVRSLSPYSPSSLQPVCTGLSDEQKASILKAAEEIVPTLPEFTVKKGRMKKLGNKEAVKILDMNPDDPEYMPLLEKYSAIYGRFDCKRHPDKPMTLHEYYVNEASFQICKRIPALISRRSELFPIARAVVRKSGYKFTKGRSRAQAEVKEGDKGDKGAKGGKEGMPKKRPFSATLPDSTQNSSPHMNETASSTHSMNGDEEDDLSLPASEQNEDSLDHNLRLLQAYGMCELAEELKRNHAAKHKVSPLATTTSNQSEAIMVAADSDVDEQEEWNKQIEEDSKVLQRKQQETPVKKFKADEDQES